MAWMDETTFKRTFRFAALASTEQLAMAYDGAEDDLRDLLLESLVTDAELAIPTLASSPRIIRAHSYLAYSIHLLNVREVKRQQDDASPATAQTVTTEYYTPNELRAMSADWRARALNTIDPYITVTTESAYQHPVYPTSVTVVSDY